MPDSNPTENLPPKHDPFDAPDAVDEADTRERVLEGGQDAGDGDDEEVRRELGLEEVGTSRSDAAARRTCRCPRERLRRRKRAGAFRIAC